MKAIIVFDWERMPDNCIECPLCQGEGYPHCTAIYKSHGSLSWYFNGDKKRNPYCPLKPMPSKRKNPITKTFGTPFNKGQAKGWNDCIDEITGETEYNHKNANQYKANHKNTDRRGDRE